MVKLKDKIKLRAQQATLRIKNFVSKVKGTVKRKDVNTEKPDKKEKRSIPTFTELKKNFEQAKSEENKVTIEKVDVIGIEESQEIPKQVETNIVVTSPPVDEDKTTEAQQTENNVQDSSAFNSFNYWKVQIEEVDQKLLQEVGVVIEEKTEEKNQTKTEEIHLSEKVREETEPTTIDNPKEEEIKETPTKYQKDTIQESQEGTQLQNDDFKEIQDDYSTDSSDDERPTTLKEKREIQRTTSEIRVKKQIEDFIEDSETDTSDPEFSEEIMDRKNALPWEDNGKDEDSDNEETTKAQQNETVEKKEAPKEEEQCEKKEKDSQLKDPKNVTISSFLAKLFKGIK